MRIGVWPAGLWSNRFAEIFADGLRQAGAEVVAVDRPYRVQAEAIDVLHIHWPEQLLWGVGAARGAWRILRAVAALRRLRRDGVTIVWMVHNLEPHDLALYMRPIWSFYSRQLVALADGIMTLSPATIEIVHAAFPDLRERPATYVWHPAYAIATSDDATGFRAQLGLPAGCRVFAFVGMIRRYKELVRLLAAFTEVGGETDMLLIAGRPQDRSVVRDIERRARSDRRIRLLLEDLSDERYGLCLAVADVVVLPSAKYLHSGSLVHALCAGKPIITPATPYALAVAEEVGARWVQTYAGPLQGRHLRDFIMPFASPSLAAFDRKTMGARALHFYGEIQSCERNASDQLGSRG